MRPNNFDIIKLQSAASINSVAVLTENVLQCSVQFTGTGSVVGTLKLQASNDKVFSPNAPVNWNDIPSATVSVSAAGSFLIPKTELCYQYIRAVFTLSSGSGNMSAQLKTIGF